MQLGAAVVVFAASLPHAVVRHPVGSLHTVDQVLDEGDLHKESFVGWNKLDKHDETRPPVTLNDTK